MLKDWIVYLLGYFVLAVPLAIIIGKALRDRRRNDTVEREYDYD